MVLCDQQQFLLPPPAALYKQGSPIDWGIRLCIGFLLLKGISFTKKLDLQSTPYKDCLHCLHWHLFSCFYFQKGSGIMNSVFDHCCGKCQSTSANKRDQGKTPIGDKTRSFWRQMDSHMCKEIIKKMCESVNWLGSYFCCLYRDWLFWNFTRRSGLFDPVCLCCCLCRCCRYHPHSQTLPGHGWPRGLDSDSAALFIWLLELSGHSAHVLRKVMRYLQVWFSIRFKRSSRTWM